MPNVASNLGQSTMALEHQGKLGDNYAENIRFSHGPVVFAGLNVPGSNNNVIMNAKECTAKSARNAPQCDASNILWVEQTFAKAKADPSLDLPETEESDESQLPQYSGYRNFMAAPACIG